jgi:hypothetical protein
MDPNPYQAPRVGEGVGAPPLGLGRSCFILVLAVLPVAAGGTGLVLALVVCSQFFWINDDRNGGLSALALILTGITGLACFLGAGVFSAQAIVRVLDDARRQRSASGE